MSGGTMLDENTIEQVKSFFAVLDSEVTLEHDLSEHADQTMLTSLLDSLAGCSSKIRVVKTQVISPVPRFRILTEGRFTGVIFSGVPGGHEFSSLILAILNANKKGKLPDELTRRRIQSLKGQIRIRTFISLSCENCPDVVQALNQMALIHPDFHHEMVDGGLVQEEIERLQIQGVPSVMIGDRLLHSGKIQFLDLLNLLESEFGVQVQATNAEELNLGEFQVLVVGGGPAGTAAAIYSARKGLKTALITERMGGQVQDTLGIENLISVPYTEGPTLSAELSRHLSQYSVKILENQRVRSIGKESLKRIELESGVVLHARSVIITTGAKWRELGIPGEKQYLGRGVAFCPHCDGPFYKGKKVAVVGGGNSGVEAAIDLSMIASEVVLLEYNDQLKADQVLVDRLHALPNVRVITSARSHEVIGDGKRVIGIQYEDRRDGEIKSMDLDGIFVQIGLIPNSGFLKDTIELTPQGEIKVDSKGRTSVPGIYAAGDVTTTPFKQIIIAMGEGAKAALSAFEDSLRTG
jgi:alkyl hydroperoxide reductase subunit F